MHGAMSSAALGKHLGTTGEAARQQLARLAEEGLVAATTRSSQSVGRPALNWNLTPAAQARFPDTHAALTVQLLQIVRASLGEAALDAMISAREIETRNSYEAALSGRANLRDRVAALAQLRTEEGYMAGWREEADGSIVLVENHCPICAAATACQGFCRAELEVFKAVLGPQASVTRQDHIVQGARRCSYSIRETAE